MSEKNKPIAVKGVSARMLGNKQPVMSNFPKVYKYTPPTNVPFQLVEEPGQGNIMLKYIVLALLVALVQGRAKQEVDDFNINSFDSLHSRDHSIDSFVNAAPQAPRHAQHWDSGSTVTTSSGMIERSSKRRLLRPTRVKNKPKRLQRPRKRPQKRPRKRPI